VGKIPRVGMMITEQNGDMLICSVQINGCSPIEGLPIEQKISWPNLLWTIWITYLRAKRFSEQKKLMGASMEPATRIGEEKPIEVQTRPVLSR